MIVFWWDGATWQVRAGSVKATNDINGEGENERRNYEPCCNNTTIGDS